LSESLFEYITEVQQLDQAKNDFILASQHNLRTPLTITKGYVEEIGAKTQSLNNAELNTFIEKTKKSLDILAQLVNGLIDITDLKVGKGGFSKEKDSKR
jgi:K+-sensing histidine kinase KdpD